MPNNKYKKYNKFTSLGNFMQIETNLSICVKNGIDYLLPEETIKDEKTLSKIINLGYVHFHGRVRRTLCVTNLYLSN
jgi:hypothetical protein